MSEHLSRFDKLIHHICTDPADKDIQRYQDVFDKHVDDKDFSIMEYLSTIPMPDITTVEGRAKEWREYNAYMYACHGNNGFDCGMTDLKECPPPRETWEKWPTWDEMVKKAQEESVKNPSLDSKVDKQIDAIHERFPWMAKESEPWKTPPGTILNDKPPLIPRRSRRSRIQYMTQREYDSFRKTPPYHLRNKSETKCHGCRSGELGQMAHMDEPDGCLFTPIQPIHFCVRGCSRIVNKQGDDCGNHPLVTMMRKIFN